MFCSGSPCARAIPGCGADGTGESCAREPASSDAPAVLCLLSRAAAAVTCAGAELSNLQV